jgi:hypothetical protein
MANGTCQGEAPVFAMRRPSDTKTSVSTEATIATGSTPQDLVAAIEELIRSKLNSNVVIDGPVSQALSRLVKLVQAASTNQLILANDLGKEACEAAINIGWL